MYVLKLVHQNPDGAEETVHRWEPDTHAVVYGSRIPVVMDEEVREAVAFHRGYLAAQALEEQSEGGRL